MNRQSAPEEIDAPELNTRGLYVFHGLDASTGRQLAALARGYMDLQEISHVFDESYELAENERLYALTNNHHNQFISHAVIHLGNQGLKLFRFDECDDEAEQAFRAVVAETSPTQYDIAS